MPRCFAANRARRVRRRLKLRHSCIHGRPAGLGPTSLVHGVYKNYPCDARPRIRDVQLASSALALCRHMRGVQRFVHKRHATAYPSLRWGGAPDVHCMDEEPGCLMSLVRVSLRTIGCTLFRAVCRRTGSQTTDVRSGRRPCLVQRVACLRRLLYRRVLSFALIRVCSCLRCLLVCAPHTSCTHLATSATSMAARYRRACQLAPCLC